MRWKRFTFGFRALNIVGTTAARSLQVEMETEKVQSSHGELLEVLMCIAGRAQNLNEPFLPQLP